MSFNSEKLWQWSSSKLFWLIFYFSLLWDQHSRSTIIPTVWLCTMKLEWNWSYNIILVLCSTNSPRLMGLSNGGMRRRVSDIGCSMRPLGHQVINTNWSSDQHQGINTSELAAEMDWERIGAEMGRNGRVSGLGGKRMGGGPGKERGTHPHRYAPGMHPFFPLFPLHYSPWCCPEV